MSFTRYFSDKLATYWMFICLSDLKNKTHIRTIILVYSIHFVRLEPASFQRLNGFVRWLCRTGILFFLSDLSLSVFGTVTYYFPLPQLLEHASKKTLCTHSCIMLLCTSVFYITSRGNPTGMGSDPWHSASMVYRYWSTILSVLM